MTDQNVTQLLRLLENHQVFASFHYLNNLSPECSIPNKEKLIKDLHRKIAMAKKLTSDINSILEKGHYPKALSQLKQAQSLVRDFPNIQTDIDFITSSIFTNEKNLKEAKLLAAKGQEEKVCQILKNAQCIDRNHGAINEVEQKLFKSKKKRRFTAILAGSLAIILPLLYLSFEHITLQQAKTLQAKADSHINNQQYDLAVSSIEQMHSRLGFVRITGQSAKLKLLNYVVVKTQSQELGIGGDGSPNTSFAEESGTERYIQSLLAQAQVMIDRSDFPGAVALYDDALEFSKANIHIDENTIAAILVLKKEVTQSFIDEQSEHAGNTFYALVRTADDFFRNDNWEQAAVSYQLAITQAETVDTLDPSEIDILQKGYQTSVINNNIETGEVAFNQNNYEQAALSFKNCLTFMKTNGLHSNNLYTNIENRLRSVKIKRIKVKLTKIIGQGDQLFGENEYELSIYNYNAGLALLNTAEGKILGHKQIKLQDRIKDKIANAEECILVNTQSEHLVATYRKILRSNFNLSRNIHFKNPEITFIGNKDDHLVYTVSAFGSKSRSANPIKYEINYKFNIHTGQWNVNDIRLEV